MPPIAQNIFRAHQNVRIEIHDLLAQFAVESRHHGNYEDQYVTPSITPRTEINVMMERNVRFGFKYRSARKTLNGSFNLASSVEANSL
jgi:hypothetical protein